MPQCPACSTLLTPRLTETYLIQCPNCGNEIVSRGAQVKSVPMPSDWSFIQLGTKGKYKNDAFEIVGRIRLQLRNDYKNFWCAEHLHGKTLWILESFNSFAVFDTLWLEYSGKDMQLRAGKQINIHGGVVGEYLEKCELLSVEGELGQWKNFESGFFFIQASEKDNTVVFTLRPQENSFSMKGYKVSLESLQLENTLSWNEWK